MATNSALVQSLVNAACTEAARIYGVTCRQVKARERYHTLPKSVFAPLMSAKRYACFFLLHHGIPKSYNHVGLKCQHYTRWLREEKNCKFNFNTQQKLGIA